VDKNNNLCRDLGGVPHISCRGTEEEKYGSAEKKNILGDLKSSLVN
jgi:hypothetical protein